MKLKHTSCHKARRAAEYPPMEEQLDALWHAMDRGDLPKVPEFYEPIKAVKEKFTKQ